jgi:ABC-type nitrate/sulfonate/bicarbonate transport system permease component
MRRSVRRSLRGVALSWLEPLSGVVALAVGWQVASIVAHNPTLVPPLEAIWSALVDQAQGDLANDIIASLIHLAGGFGAGATLGLLLALLCARFTLFAAIVDPIAEFLRPISAIAWIPIAILLFGIGRGVPMFLIFYASLFPIFVNALDGIRRVDPSLVRAAEMLGASRRLVVTHIVLPAALPAIFAGARLSLGVGWVAMVAGELVGADTGLGYRIEYFQEFFSMEGVMATIVVVGIAGYCLDALLRWLQASLLRWSPANGGAR